MTNTNSQINWMLKRAETVTNIDGSTELVYKGNLPTWAAKNLMNYANSKDTSGSQFNEWTWREGNTVYSVTLHGNRYGMVYMLRAYEYKPFNKAEQFPNQFK